MIVLRLREKLADAQDGFLALVRLGELRFCLSQPPRQIISLSPGSLPAFIGNSCQVEEQHQDQDV